MQIAAIYDIHGNLPALEAVVNDIKKMNIDRLVVGGDVIAGPMPIPVLQLLQNLKLPTDFVLGNAEAEYLRCVDNKPINGLSTRANDEAKWLSSILPIQSEEFIRTWHNILSIEHPTLGDILFCHATPRSNIEVFTTRTPEQRIKPAFEGISEKIVICGHTHMQFSRKHGSINIVNAGSVGMPFGSVGADWLVIDQDIEMMHTKYDLKKAADTIKASNYPNAKEFAENNVLNSPAKDQALKMLDYIQEQQLGQDISFDI